VDRGRPGRGICKRNKKVYGPTRENRGERCLGCNHAKTCEFVVEYFKDPVLKELYFDPEKEDGYYRDQCVFAEDIDIENTMSVTVKYSEGTLLTYSLISYS